jgi:hypothetical protein
MLNPNFTKVVPGPLLDTPNWVVWRYETRHGKQTKVPYQAVPVDGDPKARSNDSSTWSEFCEAWAEASDSNRYSGVGFMLVGSPYTGIDFDGLASNRVVDPYVANIIKIAGNPYAEFSPSGEGVRIFVSGTKLPAGKRKFTLAEPRKFGAEIYSGAETGRYLTVTGDKIDGSGNSIPQLTEWELELVYVLVSQILEDKFKKLWLNDQDFIESNYGGDQSRADAALISMLVPLFGRDPQQIEAAFSESEMGQRAKWTDRKDYRDRTIGNALNLPPLTSGLILGDQGPTKKQQQATIEQPEEITRTISMTRADKVQAEITPWLWPNRIVANNINVFSGEPDMGKGLTWTDFVARLTTHEDFPDCPNDLPGPTDVVIMGSEDDTNSTVVPRLIAAGADLTRVHFVEITENVSGTLSEGIAALDRDLPAIEGLLNALGVGVASLIVVDPIISFMGDADPNKDRDVRPIFTRMKAFAKRNQLAWLTVNHFNKNAAATSINRTSGAKTFVSAPRATWMFGKDPDDTERRLMMKGKGNLAKQGVKTLAYRIVETYIEVDGKPFVDAKDRPIGVPRIEWDGETDHNVEDILSADSDPLKKGSKKAEEFLTNLLDAAPHGVMLASDIYKAGEEATPQVGADKLKRAKNSLDYETFKLSDRWYWSKGPQHSQEFKKQYFGPGANNVLMGGTPLTDDAPPLVNREAL